MSAKRGQERPESVEEALARAARHGRNALAESVLAGRALLDAASLATTGRAAGIGGEGAGEVTRVIARVVDGLDELAEMLRADPSEGEDGLRPLVDALLASLDAEIARWEQKGRCDPDARAVLRAFLGLRELLWELGLRPESEAGAPPSASSGAEPPKASRTGAKRPRNEAPRSARRADQPKAAPAKQSRPGARRRVQRVDIES